MTLIEMNSDHREYCVCLKCRPVCRGRYTKEEYSALNRDNVCKHCGCYGSRHANSSWHAGAVLAAGACRMDSLFIRGVRTTKFMVGDGFISDNSAQKYSSEYVYESK